MKLCKGARWLQVQLTTAQHRSAWSTWSKRSAERRDRFLSSGVASAIGWVEEQADHVIPEGSLAYQARTARFCQAPVSATPAPGSAPRQVYAQSRADHQQPQWPVLPKRLDMMCVASGSALSIATFGLFPLAGLDVSPVANKPAAQTQVSIVKVHSQAQCRLGCKSDACIHCAIILCRKPFCVYTSSSSMLILSAMGICTSCTYVCRLP